MTVHDEVNRCEFLICVAMYDEDCDNIKPTMQGIFENIKAFKDNGVNINNIGVVFIVDGVGPFFRTYGKSHGMREYLKPMIDLD
jgi:hypothetical protein